MLNSCLICLFLFILFVYIFFLWVKNIVRKIKFTQLISSKESWRLIVSTQIHLLGSFHLDGCRHVMEFGGRHCCVSSSPHTTLWPLSSFMMSHHRTLWPLTPGPQRLLSQPVGTQGLLHAPSTHSHTWTGGRVGENLQVLILFSNRVCWISKLRPALCSSDKCTTID